MTDAEGAVGIDERLTALGIETNIDLYLGINTDHTGRIVAIFHLGGFFSRHLSRVDVFVGEGMVNVQADNLTVTHQENAAVTDAGNEHAALRTVIQIDRYDGGGRSAFAA